MAIHNHKLDKVAFKQTPNVTAGFEVVPRYLVIHYSADCDISRTVKNLRNPNTSTPRSAHLVIGRDGEVIQLARFNQRAWHCGKSQWGDLKNLNDYSIGIELINGGKLEIGKDGKYLVWEGTVIDPDEVGWATHKHEKSPAPWHKFTHAQIARCKDIAAELMAVYGLEDILGHDDISPGRKVDPGPLFPMSEAKAYCMEEKVGFVLPGFALEKNKDAIDATIQVNGQKLSLKMTAAEARALKDWLDQVLPQEVI